MDLDFRTRDASDTDREKPVEAGDRVSLYSETLDCSLSVEVTHVDGDQFGGNLAETPGTLHLEAGDHLHFSSQNILEIE